MFKEITQIYGYKQHFVAKGISDGGGEINANLCDVRAAIVAPISDIPCYYLVCGVMDKENEHGKKPVLFVTEYEDRSTSKVFLKLFDDVTRLSIQTLYADYGNETFYVNLWKSRQASGVDVVIRPAPSVNDIGYGDALIGEYIRYDSLITPRGSEKPMMSQQVNSMNSLGYQGDKPAYETFYAWNSLRFILAGLVKNPLTQMGRLAYNDIGNPARFDSKHTGLGAKFHEQHRIRWAV